MHNNQTLTIFDIAILDALLRHQRTARERYVKQPIFSTQFTISYSDLAKSANFPNHTRRLGKTLHRIIEWCKTEEKPPLPSLVINKNLGRPGTGFFEVLGKSKWQCLAEQCLLATYPTIYPKDREFRNEYEGIIIK